MHEFKHTPDAFFPLKLHPSPLPMQRGGESLSVARATPGHQADARISQLGSLFGELRRVAKAGKGLTVRPPNRPDVLRGGRHSQAMKLGGKSRAVSCGLAG
jgi:hypothetical protein